jgi:predicted kinase
VAFHRTAAVAPAESHFGSPTSVLEQVLRSFDNLFGLFCDAAIRDRLQALRGWILAQQVELAAQMAARKQMGFVRECHGDLHLTNLVLIEQKVRLFDCIEFNDELRWIDIASEFAFTYVDLLAHGKPGLANWFINEVLSCNGDYEAAPLIRFYAVYRALVCANVAALLAQQNGSGTQDALNYITLAEHLVAPPPLLLMITHGVSGSGKTHASDVILQGDANASTLRLRSDVERKRLFGLGALGSSDSNLGDGIYTADSNVRTYDRLRDLARGLLRSKWSVIVDGTFLKRAQRDDFRNLAGDVTARFCILAPHASPDQLRERILSRASLGQDSSEATLAVLTGQLQTIEPLTADEPVWPSYFANAQGPAPSASGPLPGKIR